ncbi:NAD(P)/FAD-dependent oxidoreductase [Glaciecola sp. SC05]|uniref:NAD(P)/FAD-dependent oxidoreductase n=1 Tax=Glaciecola sp. SC05 TaxID=1987355 RepID=UPI0035281B3D
MTAPSLTIKNNSSRIIIIGANFAGLSAASKLSKCHKVTVVDSREHFQWTPNIHEILSDVKKDTSLRLSLDTIVSRLGHCFIKQTVTHIDTEAQLITLNDAQTLHYDVLLIASGHTRSNYGIAGASEYAYGFRTADDVLGISRAIDALLMSRNTANCDTSAANGHPQDSSPININIVGGGFTGVEVLGELLRKYASHPQVNLHVIESGSRLVQALPEKLSHDIQAQCDTHRVSFHFNRIITEVQESNIRMADNTSLPTDLTIWTAGTKLPAYLDTLNAKLASNGISVNKALQSDSFENIFVAGDCANFTKPVAKQASMAIDMGAHAAKNITRYCAKQSLKTFYPRTQPVLLSLGDINTYFIKGNVVLASPLLAAAKEAVYQLWMARFSSTLPLDQSIMGIADRVTSSSEKLLLAEVLKARPRVLLGRSKVLI